MTEQIETNGSNGHTKPAKPESALDRLLASVKGQKVNETDKKKAAEAFKKRMVGREELVKALEDFDAASDVAAANMVKCFGSQQVSVEGTRYAPTSRGERVYYKKLSDTPPKVVTL